ncbi:MAG: TolC family protein [Planctomycetes bacterium]|nr:TolC family protein [Planctomycetota bacterium]
MKRVVSAALLVLLGCTSYEPDPAEPLELLRALEALSLRELGVSDVAPVVTDFEVRDGLTVREACAVAVRFNPRLVRLRAEVGVAEARLVQAGLLEDPVIGWSAMDAASGAVVDGKLENPAWLSGFSLTWQVPRPGELDAQQGVAGARIQAAGADLAGAEWTLVREVYLGYLGVLVARARRQQLERLDQIAQRALDYFEGAQRAGAATALEAGLARVAAGNVRADELGARVQETLAQQALNAQLGLPPSADWEPQDTLDQLARRAEAAVEDPQQLVRASLDRRPDLQGLLAEHRAAEEQLRLQVALQWPQLGIGTSFSLQLPLFTRFNQPAIETALRRREVARAAVRAGLHTARAEVHAALAQLEQARAVLEVFEATLGPQTEETLRLTELAFAAREVTPLGILTAQRQVLDTQTRLLNARQSWAAAQIRLDSACGRLLPAARTPLPQPRDSDSEVPE